LGQPAVRASTTDRNHGTSTQDSAAKWTDWRGQIISLGVPGQGILAATASLQDGMMALWGKSDGLLLVSRKRLLKKKGGKEENKKRKKISLRRGI
jgi:hypothetical protein